MFKTRTIFNSVQLEIYFDRTSDTNRKAKYIE